MARRRPTRPCTLIAVAAFLVLLQHVLQHAEAISANPNPIFNYDNIPVTDGARPPPIFLRGDESFHWYEDGDGYTLIDDPGRSKKKGQPARKVYADVDPRSGKLFSTGIPLGFLNATINRAGLRKHVKPSSALRRQMCGRYCKAEKQSNVRGSSSASSRAGSNRRNLQEHENRRRLLSTTNSLRNLVVLIRFADHQHRILPSVEDYNVLLNGPGGEGTVAPTGSVNDVFISNSYGDLTLESTIYSWVTVSKPEAYYADGQSGLAPKIFEAIHEALDVVDSDASFDLSRFNTDHHKGDAFIDAITVFHSGYGAEFGGVDCYGAEEEERIWSHSWYMYTGDWTSRDGRVTVSSYHINPGLWGTCGSKISRIGVIAHETAHFLGLPDLYDPEGGNGVGAYCLMSDSWGIDGSQLHPPMLSPWSKIELGWLTPKTLDVKGDFELRESWQYPDVHKIELGSKYEYLLIENRQPGSYDVLLPLGGLAIWHIDEYMAYHTNSRAGYPGEPDWPVDHYHVALLQADGQYHLEKGINRGDFNDLFRRDFSFGVDYLFPSEADPTLGPFPNTDSYRQGVLSRTNHFISDISVTGQVMTYSFLPSSPCRPNEIHFDLLLLTDGKGNDVSWQLKETHSDSVVLTGDGYGNYARESVTRCLPAKCYTFTIHDAGGDGLCCSRGYGGYSIRLNGLKMASASIFESEDEQILQCVGVHPSVSPTPSPLKLSDVPSEMPSIASSLAPSINPSLQPSSMPTGVCGREYGLLEINMEGSLGGSSWEMKDIFNNTIASSAGRDATGGSYSVHKCILLKSCYTFSLQGSREDESHDSSEASSSTVKLDGDVLASSNDYRNDHTIMFGSHCLHNGDATCTPTGAASPMSMFRLELAADDGKEVAWNLTSVDRGEVVRSAGPFARCQVESLALCLQREGCYEFALSSGDDGSGIFTVMFSHVDDLSIQNFTGPVAGRQRFYLGSCYSMNFG